MHPGKIPEDKLQLRSTVEGLYKKSRESFRTFEGILSRPGGFAVFSNTILRSISSSVTDMSHTHGSLPVMIVLTNFGTGS